MEITLKDRPLKFSNDYLKFAITKEVSDKIRELNVKGIDMDIVVYLDSIVIVIRERNKDES